MYNIVHHKSDTIAKVLKFSTPNVTFKRDPLSPRLASWNVLLQHLSLVQLTQGLDKFRWTLHDSSKFSMGSMYRDLIQPEVPIDNNGQISNMKIPLKTKAFCMVSSSGGILNKHNMVRHNWHTSIKVCIMVS
jgi:hypothetical protein